MIVIGLTGSIGMGKSTAAKMLQRLGIAVHDSDAAVHKALYKNLKIQKKLRALFPAAFDVKTGEISRAKLGAIVFNNKADLTKLEKLLHPEAVKSQQAFIKKMRAAGKTIAVLEIPLLFETGAERRVDYTITVTAPYFIQRRRVLARPGMTAEKFKAISQRQIKDSQKRRRSDFVVHTGLGRALTFRSLRHILGEIKKGQHARNRSRY